uniref:Uncharacterized protein n=1 Tax=Nicotiana tabacum TaxID=4097 RepID=A0A1S4BWV1_TOBAC|nr:PREDICTED: uncharacterized protein LOC107812734 [Nicotiana tabacum]
MVVPCRDGSHVWKMMLEYRDDIENQIIWQPRMGSSLFWFDNWTGLGALYFITPHDVYCDESVHNVYEVVQEGALDENRLMDILPHDLALHVIENVKPPVLHDDLDRPFWMLEARGNFTIKYSWEYFRRRRDSSIAYKNMWAKGLPFKIAFFMWKIWKGKLPLDDTFRRMGYFMSSRCWCCLNPDEETLAHVFYRSYAAYTALPSIILWELWKRRNRYKHGEVVSISIVIYQVSSTFQALVKVRKPSLQNVPHKLPDLLHILEVYTLRLKVTLVLWDLPTQGWININTDGASRGKPSSNSIGFVLRDEEGDVSYYTEGIEILCAAWYIHILVQTDSMLLKNVVEGTWIAPWAVVAYVEEIKGIMDRCNVRVSHIMREGNKLADYLANYALDNSYIKAHSFDQLEARGRRIMNSDKLQCPYLRIKVARS